MYVILRNQANEAFFELESSLLYFELLNEQVYALLTNMF